VQSGAVRLARFAQLPTLVISRQQAVAIRAEFTAKVVARCRLEALWSGLRVLAARLASRRECSQWCRGNVAERLCGRVGLLGCYQHNSDCYGYPGSKAVRWKQNPLFVVGSPKAGTSIPFADHRRCGYSGLDKSFYVTCLHMTGHSKSARFHR
jgi:hypothetical protein